MSATNVARAGKRGNICIGNNVSATMRPRLPEPLNDIVIRVFWFASCSNALAIFAIRIGKSLPHLASPFKIMRLEKEREVSQS